MAGIKQHHVWQMLQRGFSWKKECNDNYIWVYRNGQPPEQTTTRLFGQEEYFYGPENSKADLCITQFENYIQNFVQKVRNFPDKTSLDANLSSKLILHLKMRSRFIRNEPARVAIDFIKQKLGNEFSIDEIDQIGEVWMKGTQNAHNEILEENFREIDFEQAKFYRKLNFRVLRLSNEEFILPDTCLAFFTDNGCTPASQLDDKIETVIVPISSQVAIIGEDDNSLSRTPKIIRESLASCAYEAFISKNKSSELENLSRRIGENSKLNSENMCIDDLSLRLDIILKRKADGLTNAEIFDIGKPFAKPIGVDDFIPLSG